MSVNEKPARPGRSPRHNLALAVSAALALGPATAQTLGPAAGAHRSPSPLLPVQALDPSYADVFYETPVYTFCDAKLLAHVWGVDTWGAKLEAGAKIANGLEANVQSLLADARGQLEERHRSVGDVCTIDDADNPPYSWEDLEILAQYWGEPTANDAKLKVEDALFRGFNVEVLTALNEARGV